MQHTWGTFILCEIVMTFFAYPPVGLLPCRYVRPQRVWFFQPFWSEIGYRSFLKPNPWLMATFILKSYLHQFLQRSYRWSGQKSNQLPRLNPYKAWRQWPYEQTPVWDSKTSLGGRVGNRKPTAWTKRRRNKCPRDRTVMSERGGEG